MCFQSFISVYCTLSSPHRFPRIWDSKTLIGEPIGQLCMGFHLICTEMTLCAILWQRHEIQLRLHSPQEVLRFNNSTEIWSAIPSPIYSMAFGGCCKCASKWVSAWLCKLFLYQGTTMCCKIKTGRKNNCCGITCNKSAKAAGSGEVTSCPSMGGTFLCWIITVLLRNILLLELLWEEQ